LYFHYLQTCKLLIKRLCFNIIFGISSIFVCTKNIIKFHPTSREACNESGGLAAIARGLGVVDAEDGTANCKEIRERELAVPFG
jgi:hypothetical protein